MRSFTLQPHLSRYEIRQRMQEADDSYQFKRWQTIYFVTKGFKSSDIADMVGIGRDTVKQFVFKYNHNGVEGFEIQPRGGRKRSHLSLEKEREILASYTHQSSEGHIITASLLQKPFEKIIGKKVHRSYMYDLMHRHGWRKVSPRPRHPSTDTGKQEEFKKKSAGNR